MLAPIPVISAPSNLRLTDLLERMHTAALDAYNSFSFTFFDLLERLENGSTLSCRMIREIKKMGSCTLMELMLLPT